jgi:hypothetical protein
MTKTDLRLEYQKVSGHQLTTINQFVDSPHSDVYCDTCDSEVTGTVDLDEDLAAYITWLEERVISCRSANHKLTSHAHTKIE